MSGVEVIPAASSAITGFSYESLTPEEADIARTAAASIRTTLAGSLREIGTHLSQVRAALPHGSFALWVEAELGLTDRTARNYMHVADFLEGKPEIISVLPPTTLYALSAPTAAKDVVDLVVAAAEAGEPLHARVINTRLDAAKQEARELKAAQRRNPKASRETLAANKAKQQQRWEAQQKQEEQDRARKRREAEERMQALAAAILAGPGDIAALLSRALFNYDQCQALKALLDAGLRDIAITHETGGRA